MSLDKAIGKREKRKPYRGSKAFDRTCRNHGTCEWCIENRTISSRRQYEEIKESIKDGMSDTEAED